MITPITHPPRIDPTLSTAVGRRMLIGRHVDEALYMARGYEVEVIYGAWGSRAANRKPSRVNPRCIAVAVNGENCVTAVR